MQSRFLYGQHVRANGIRQHYLRFGGEGPPLLLLPGITSPAPSWSFVAERFAQHFDTYVLDLRGRGLSQSGPDLDYGVQALTADVIALADALNYQSLTLVGHSLGARVALNGARQMGTRLARLVLVDPPVSGPHRRPYPTPLTWYIDAIHKAVHGASAAEIRSFTPNWREDHLRIRAEWLHTCCEEAVTASYSGFHTDDIFPWFRALATPSLLLVAGKGGVILDEDVQEILSLAPRLEVRTVAGAGHMIPFDDFDGFFAAVDPFVGTGAAP